MKIKVAEGNTTGDERREPAERPTDPGSERDQVVTVNRGAHAPRRRIRRGEMVIARIASPSIHTRTFQAEEQAAHAGEVVVVTKHAAEFAAVDAKVVASSIERVGQTAEPDPGTGEIETLVKQGALVAALDAH